MNKSRPITYLLPMCLLAVYIHMRVLFCGFCLSCGLRICICRSGGLLAGHYVHAYSLRAGGIPSHINHLLSAALLFRAFNV